jgi:hypothetical protein
VNDLLDRIERELMQGVRRRVHRRRARRRVLLLGALALAGLALASAASAVSGIGPAAGLFEVDEAIPESREPEPGWRLAALHAGGWDLLVYRSEPPRFGAGVRPYCLALARGDRHRHGNSTECEHPLTKAARLMRTRLELGENRGGAWISNPQRPPTAPFYGLLLGDAERVTIAEEGRPPVEAELSPPFRLELPGRSRRVLRDLNPRQRRMTANLPRSLTARAFLAALEAPEVQVGQRIPVVEVTATFSEHRSVTLRTGGQLVRPQPKAVPLEERYGIPRVRLTGVGPDGRRWEAAGLTGPHGLISASAAIAPWDYGRGALMGGGGGWARTLAERAVVVDVSRHLPGGVPSPGSAAIYGVVRGDVRSIVFAGRGVAPARAKLSPVFATARGPRRTVRVRLFLAVVEASTVGRYRPRVRP